MCVCVCVCVATVCSSRNLNVPSHPCVVVSSLGNTQNSVVYLPYEIVYIDPMVGRFNADEVVVAVDLGSLFQHSSKNLSPEVIVPDVADRLYNFGSFAHHCLSTRILKVSWEASRKNKNWHPESSLSFFLVVWFTDSLQGTRTAWSPLCTGIFPQTELSITTPPTLKWSWIESPRLPPSYGTPRGSISLKWSSPSCLSCEKPGVVDIRCSPCSHSTMATPPNATPLSLISPTQIFLPIPVPDYQCHHHHPDLPLPDPHLLSPHDQCGDTSFRDGRPASHWHDSCRNCTAHCSPELCLRSSCLGWGPCSCSHLLDIVSCLTTTFLSLHSLRFQRQSCFSCAHSVSAALQSAVGVSVSPELSTSAVIGATILSLIVVCELSSVWFICAVSVFLPSCPLQTPVCVN